jgi:hypothetical protein
MGLDAVPVAVDAMLSISQSTSWKARISVLEFLQVGQLLGILIANDCAILPPVKKCTYNE